MCSVSVFNASARHLLSDFAQTREENKANGSPEEAFKVSLQEIFFI